MPLTASSKRAIDWAYQEAARFHNNFIGTEHIPLGLLREGEGIAFQLLTAMGLHLERTREEVLRLQSAPDAAWSLAVRPLPNTTHARRVIGLAQEEAVGAGFNSAGTSHLLLVRKALENLGSPSDE